MTTIEQKYKKLSDIDHVMHRPGMYIGSTSNVTEETWVIDETTNKALRKSVAWNPGLVKIFDEILSNSIDESKRQANLTTIKVKVDRATGAITVWDNGGIPVEKHKEHNQYIPEMIFTELRAGSNFNDDEDRIVVGTNGVGSTITNIFSNKFRVETCDGKKKFVQTFTKNLSKWGPQKITNSPGPSYTKITFTPDYVRLGTRLNDGNYLKLVKRVYDAAGCNQDLRIYLNGKLIKVCSFKDYVKYYKDEYIFQSNEHWSVGLANSEVGFQTISFINGGETIDLNSTHIEYLTKQIVDHLRVFFKRRHKIDVKPSEIKNHLFLFVNATVFNPKYSSQTKEKLITDPKEYGTSITISDSFIKKLLKSHVIDNILDWIEAKKFAKERADLRKLNRKQSKTNPRRIAKLSDANEKKDRSKCILFLTEGESASGGVRAACNKTTTGVYALKGKPVNVMNVTAKQLMTNLEFTDIMTAVGLQIGEKVESLSDLRYGKIAFMTDQDVDGAHISGLLINMFYKYWPELFALGVIHQFNTPLVKIWIGKQVTEFFSEEEFHTWKQKNPDTKYRYKYFKGLGTSKVEDFRGYFKDMNKHLVPLTIEDSRDKDMIALAFTKSMADDRKIWLDIEVK